MKNKKSEFIYFLLARQDNHNKFHEVFREKEKAESRKAELLLLFPNLEITIDEMLTADKKMWLSDEFFDKKTASEILKRLLGDKSEKSE